MKKWTALLLTAAMLMSLTACSLTFLNNKVETKPDPKEDPDSGVLLENPTAPAAPDISAVEPEIPSGTPESLPPAPDKGDDAAGTPDSGGEYIIRISHTDVTLKTAGETFRLSVWDSNGKEPDACTFVSDDPEIATVDEAGGEVTAAAPGITNIVAHVEFGGEKQDLKCIVRCSWKAEEEEEPAQPVSGGASDMPSLSSFFSTLQGKYDGLGNMMALDGELLDVYYPGLSSIAAVEEVLVQETMISIANVAVGLVKLSDNATMDDIIAVQNALQARITAQADGGAFYPDSCETWKNGVITSVSNRVGMFVYPDSAQAMADLFVLTYSN